MRKLNFYYVNLSKIQERADEWVWGFDMGFRKSWMSLECLKSVQENLELEKEAVLQNWDGGGRQTQKKVLV